MLPVQRERRTREGGAARESKNETREKGTVPLAAECLRKRGNRLGQHGTVCSSVVLKIMPMARARENRMRRREL